MYEMNFLQSIHGKHFLKLITFVRSEQRGIHRSNHPEVFLEKSVLKICTKFTGEHPCRSVISIKLLCNFIEIPLRHGCSPVNLLHIFRIPFTKKTSGRLLLHSEPCQTSKKNFFRNVCKVVNYFCKKLHFRCLA